MTNEQVFADVLRICDEKTHFQSANSKPVTDDGAISDQKAYASAMSRIILSLYDFKIDETMPTAYATIQRGGKGLIGINPDFWGKCSDVERWQLLLHETGHLQYMHFVRDKYL